MEPHRWTILFLAKSANELAEVCRQVALMQRFTWFTFSTHVVPKLSVICSRLSAPQLFQHWVVHFKIAPKLSLKLGSWLVPRCFVGFSRYWQRNGLWDGLQNKKRRIPFHFESSIVPLRFCNFLWSLRRVYSRKSQETPGYEAGSRGNESLVEKSEANPQYFLFFN